MVDLGHIVVQVAVRERRRSSKRTHFASKETDDKVLHGLLEGGSTKNCLDLVSNVLVETVNGGVESCRGANSTEGPVVKGVLDAISLGVHLGDLCSRLAQCGFVHGHDNRVGKDARGRQYLATI